MSTKCPKPILKWVGGKTQLLDILMSEFPTEINNYHEIFLGGGSVLISLLHYVKQGLLQIRGNIYAYDVNQPLIHVYKNIQTNHRELYDEIQKLIVQFNSCINENGNENGNENSNMNIPNRKPETLDEALVAKETYYYWIRRQYNKLDRNAKNSILGSAMFIFLNKTCFRGVFRMGPNGFNVPYGHYKNPEIINKEHLDEIHELIQPVIFEACDFTVSLNRIEPGDFAYLDPPYVPEKQTSFVGYTENGFTTQNHIHLFEKIHEFAGANKKMILSNADVALIHTHFTLHKKYRILSVVCKRTIHSKNPKTSANEVIIKNY